MTTLFLTDEERVIYEYLDDDAEGWQLVDDAPAEIVEMFKQINDRYDSLGELIPGD